MTKLVFRLVHWESAAFPRLSRIVPRELRPRVEDESIAERQKCTQANPADKAYGSKKNG